MRKTTKAQIEADGRLLQKVTALMEYIKKQQRYIDERKEAIKAELDGLLTHINGELEIMNGMHREIEAELAGVVEVKKPEEKPETEEAADDLQSGTVTPMARGRGK